MKITIEIPDNEFKNLIATALKDFDSEKKKEGIITLYTINQVAKMLKKSHTTIKKLVERGIIKATKDNQITEAAINDYLQNT